MAGGASLIPVREIARDFRFGFRFDYQDALLARSLEKKGLVLPLLITKGKKGAPAHVVAGHKRLFWARQRKQKKIRVQILESNFTKKELFLLSLFSNWNQSFSELERMEALRKAEKVFHFTIAEIQEEILPALGLPSAPGILESYRRVVSLPAEIHQLIHAKKIPFHSASALARFTREEQKFLVENVFHLTHLTSNQLLLISEWLLGLKKIRRVPLEGVLEEKSVREVLSHGQMDDRTRGERLFAAVRTLRFPTLSKEEKKFARLKGRLEALEEIRMERPEGFEAEGISLHIRLKNRENLEKVLRSLESQTLAVKEFFDSESAV